MSGPKLSDGDYRAACKFREAADRRQFRLLLLGFLAVAATIVAAFVAYPIWPRAWIPIFGAAGFLILALVAAVWFAARRCPKCGRLVSRRKMKLVHTESGSYQTSGDQGVYSVDTTHLVYRTRCDRCGADIWVWKWKYG